MALQLTGGEFEAIRDLFRTIDQDGDGQLTKEELTEYFGKSKQDKVDFNMRLMDLDRSGTVEFHEFLEMVAFLDYDKGITEKNIKQFFSALDADGNGILSADELRKFYNVMATFIVLNCNLKTNDEFESLISSLDSNGDGTIDCEELIKGYFQS